MPWNLLILPLVAGYYLVSYFRRYMYRQQRWDAQRLIFESILRGVLLLFISYFIRTILLYIAKPYCVIFCNHLPLKMPFLCTALFTLVISYIFVKFGNKFLDKKIQIRNAINDTGNELELLFLYSFDKKKLLLITLDNGKIYIAWVKELPIPSASPYIRFIPAISGYRDEKKNMILTTQYLSIYDQYLNEGVKKEDNDIVIDVKKISSVSNFDPDMYQRFNIDKIKGVS